MATKSFIIPAILMIAVISINSTCQKQGLGCANTVYSFQIGVKVYPQTTNIHIGDTLWIEMTSPTSLIDTRSNKIVNYSGAANLGTVFGLDEIINKDSFRVAFNSFDYSLVLGKNVPNPASDIRQYSYVEQNSKYLFKLGIIPKEKGVFGFGLSDAPNVYRLSDNCTKAGFQTSIENIYHHFYLNPVLNSSNFDTTRPSGGYYFIVN